MLFKILFRSVILLIFLTFVVWGFYWLQFRPSQIKHDCSWVEKHSDAIPAIPSQTEEELRLNGMLNDCAAPNPSNMFIKLGRPELAKEKCEETNRRVIEEHKSTRLAIPAKSWWESANPKQYEFCLHDKGL